MEMNSEDMNPAIERKTENETGFSNVCERYCDKGGCCRNTKDFVEQEKKTLPTEDPACLPHDQRNK